MEIMYSVIGFSTKRSIRRYFQEKSAANSLLNLLRPCLRISSSKGSPDRRYIAAGDYNKLVTKKQRSKNMDSYIETKLPESLEYFGHDELHHLGCSNLGRRFDHGGGHVNLFARCDDNLIRKRSMEGRN